MVQTVGHFPAAGDTVRLPGWCHLTAMLSSLTLLVACQGRLDGDLCPVDQPPVATTIMLLDTSDPLTPQHQAQLNRLLREMNPEVQADPNSAFLLDKGEQLLVYELVEDPSRLEPSLRLCNPGINPNRWQWWRELVEGRAIAQRRWQHFDDMIQNLFATEPGSPRSSSPLLEALGVIVPRHVTSHRLRAGDSSPVHLILFSDLLQHSAALSHYGDYPEAEQLLQVQSLRHLTTNLAGVEVSIFRLERSRQSDSRWQTVDHYYWWPEIVRQFGGQVIHQSPI